MHLNNYLDHYEEQRFMYVPYIFLYGLTCSVYIPYVSPSRDLKGPQGPWAIPNTPLPQANQTKLCNAKVLTMEEVSNEPANVNWHNFGDSNPNAMVA